MRERDIERALVKRVKEKAGEVRKVSWIGRRGAPDRLVMIQGRRPIWVELKAPGLDATPQQLREHTRMRLAGCNVVVINSLEAIDALFP